MSIQELVLQIIENDSELSNAFYFDPTDAFHRDAVIILSRRLRAPIEPMLIFTQEALDDRRITAEQVAASLRNALPRA